MKRFARIGLIVTGGLGATLLASLAMGYGAPMPWGAHPRTFQMQADLAVQIFWADIAPSPGQLQNSIDQMAQYWNLLGQAPARQKVNYATYSPSGVSQCPPNPPTCGAAPLPPCCGYGVFPPCAPPPLCGQFPRPPCATTCGEPGQAPCPTCGTAYCTPPYCTGPNTPSGCVVAPECGILVDGVNGIQHRSRPSYYASTTPAYALCVAGECDITIFNGATLSLLERHDQPGGQGTTRQGQFLSTVGHEMGHTLGLGHPEPMAQNCAPNTQSPLMCQASVGPSNSGGGSKWDHAAPDDIDALRAYSGGTTGQLQLVHGAVAKAGSISLGAATLNMNIEAIARPRIGCSGSANKTPHCVVATTSNACSQGFHDCVRLVSLDTGGVLGGGGGYTVNSSVTLDNASRHEVDVAFGSPSNMAVSVRLDSGDPANGAPYGAIWWASWNLVPGGGVAQGTIQTAQGIAATTREPPRIAFNNRLNGGLGGYVVVYTDPLLNLWVSTSDTKGRSWTIARVVAYPPNAPVRKPVGHFDISCPTHQASDLMCHILFQDGSFQFGAGFGNVNIENASGVSQHCSFDPTVPGAAVLTCNTTQYADAMQVSLADYRPPSAQHPQFGMLASVSRYNNNGQPNTALLFHGNGAQLFNGNQLSANIFDIPFSNPAAKYGFGGLSCDWSEYAGRFLCVGH